MARQHRLRLFIAGLSRPILVPTVVASLVFISACSRRGHSPPPRGSQSEPRIRGSVATQTDPADTEGPTGRASDRTAQPQIPLPPGWAEQFAYQQAAAAEDQIDPHAVRADPVDSPVVDDADWSGAFDVGGPDGIDVGPLATSSRDTRVSGSRTPPPWRRPVPSKPAPRRGGDYTVMLLVFAAPLFLLIPLAWAWRLMHVLWPRRLDGRGAPRVAEVR